MAVKHESIIDNIMTECACHKMGVLTPIYGLTGIRAQNMDNMFLQNQLGGCNMGCFLNLIYAKGLANNLKTDGINGSVDLPLTRKGEACHI